MAKILGIDLGTTFSAMAVVEAGEPKILENKEGARTTPSVVALGKNGERLAGILAKRQQTTNPKNTIFSIRDKWFKPLEISAMLLQKLKRDAEEKLGEEIQEAIITCPAYFDDSQRKATKVAGEVAGFKVRRVINEPTAAALAYGLTKKGEKKIVVYDFGGGTFDVSILDVGEDTVEVISTGGDAHLGGEDFDQKVLVWLVDRFKQEQGIDLSKDQLALQRLKEAAEKAKIELSTTLETEINLPFITSDASGPKHLLYKLTRGEFENLVKEYIKRSIELTKQTLKEAKLEVKDIDEVVLVGGQTRMPKLQEEIKDFFGKESHKGINPDEVVAMGAAVQAGILQGEVKDVLLLDVTPLSLGIETLGQVNTILIPKNTTVPTSKTQVFSTAVDNQPSVEIHVLQGERPMVNDNKSLGRFILDGIPPSPRGVPQIEVVFDIDANGILQVSAKDKATGKSQSIKIEGSCGADKEEVEKMKKDAELHIEEDRKKQELIQERNTADNLIYTVEKTLRDAGDKISAEIKKEIQEKITELKKIKDQDNLEEIKQKVSELSGIAQKIGSQMYSKDQGNQEKKPDQEKKPESDQKQEQGKDKDVEEGKYRE